MIKLIKNYSDSPPVSFIFKDDMDYLETILKDLLKPYYTNNLKYTFTLVDFYFYFKSESTNLNTDIIIFNNNNIYNSTSLDKDINSLAENIHFNVFSLCYENN